MKRFGTDQQRWQAICRRDPAADGHFVYSVSTTGVFCRPSCSSRPPRRENVGFHSSAEEARQAGFRACKRCRPEGAPRLEREAALVARACRAIESSAEQPRLHDLARLCGLSAQHFHRLFKQVTGVTPRSYAVAQRQRRLEQKLAAGASVTDALYEAGFGSSSRLYEHAAAELGMAPSAYRKGAAGEELWVASGRCSLGRVLAAATPRGICAILLGERNAELVRELRKRFAGARLCKPPQHFDALFTRVLRCLDEAGGTGSATLPLDIRGTVFQRRVWEALRAVPAGTTASYAELAARLGKPRAARAVAAACAANNLAVAVPCHRAVGSDGSLTGYRWGLKRKRTLIEREKKKIPT